MLEKKYIFLFLSILGITLLLFLSLTIQPPKLKISEVSEKYLNQEIQISAKIINVRDYPSQSFQVLTLQDQTGNITATSNSNKQFKIDKTQIYKIKGKLEENFYNNKTTLQLNVDKIIHAN